MGVSTHHLAFWLASKWCEFRKWIWSNRGQCCNIVFFNLWSEVMEVFVLAPHHLDSQHVCASKLNCKYFHINIYKMGKLTALSLYITSSIHFFLVKLRRCNHEGSATHPQSLNLFHWTTQNWWWGRHRGSFVVRLCECINVPSINASAQNIVKTLMGFKIDIKKKCSHNSTARPLIRIQIMWPISQQ